MAFDKAVLSRTDPDGRLDRLIFFSDALFAIAMTLLVLDIETPRLDRTAGSGDHLAALARLLPSFAAFFLSFVVIAVFWIGHMRLFRQVRRFDRRIVWPNLLFLLSIALMPFATAYMGSNRNTFVPALVYNGNLLLSSVLLWWLARRAFRFGDIDGVSQEDRRTAVTVVAAAVCVALAFVVPQLSQIGMLLSLLGSLVVKRGQAE